jgi:hypothetical protein
MLAVTACTAVALVAGAAVAEEVKPVSKSGTALDDMKVARDKETGKLRAATPEEVASLKASGGGFATNIVVVTRPVTTVLVRPDGSAVARRSLDDMDNIVLSRDANGKAVLRHARKATAPAPAPATDLPKE